MADTNAAAAAQNGGLPDHTKQEGEGEKKGPSKGELKKMAKEKEKVG